MRELFKGWRKASILFSFFSFVVSTISKSLAAKAMIAHAQKIEPPNWALSTERATSTLSGLLLLLAIVFLVSRRSDGTTLRLANAIAAVVATMWWFVLV